MNRLKSLQFLSTLILIELNLLFFLVAATSYVINKQNEASERLNSAIELHNTSSQMADQLRQSSDDLTRMVRSYAATGDSNFVNYFYTILDIRNGKVPRPEQYHRIYWDFKAVEEKAATSEDGERISLHTLMEDAGFADEEFELLAEAQRRSDKLVEMEETAMNAIRGKFRDNNGAFTVVKPPDRELALQILFGEEYHKAKKEIIQPINNFLISSETRTSNEIAYSQKEISRLSAVLIFILSFGLISIPLFILTAYRYHRISRSELKESGERFRATFKQAAVGIAHVSPEGRFLRINRKWCDIVGYSHEEMLELTFQDITHPDDLDSDLEYVRQVLKGDIETYSMEKRYIQKSGQIVWIDLTVSLVRNEAGQARWFVSVINDIIERKQTEEKLKESEENFRGVFESMTDVFTRSDMNGKCVLISPSIYKMIGYKPEEIVGKDLADFYTDPKHRTEIVNELKSTKDVINYEIDIVRKDGKTITVSANAQLYYNSNGEPLGVEGNIRDITEKIKAQRKLQESEHVLKASQQMAHVGNWVWEIEKDIITWSEEVYRIYGITPGTEVTYDRLMEVIHPEDREYHNKKTAEWLENISAEPYEYRVITPNGSLKHVYAMGEVERDESGNPLKFIGTTQDISQIKKAESEHDKLFNSSFDLICIAGFDGYFKEVNPFWEQVTGYSLEELYAKPFSEFIHPDDVEKTASEVKELLEGKRAAIGFENRYISKAGKEIHLSWTVTPALEEKLMYCIARDITAQKLAENKVALYQQRLKDLANELTISEEKIRKQIAVDLHDHVGQMLASMRMQMARITDMEENPELVIRMKNISQGLLKSIQATRAAIFDLSPPQLNEIGLAAATHDWMKEQIEQKHHIKTTISSESDNFKLDENTRFLLFRSIKELMMNTVKHAKAGQLDIALKRKGNTLEITVEDDGVGFNYNPDLLRLKSDSYGLFSIQERISDLGGSMEVDSVIDKGTKIKLAIPLNEK